MMLILNLTFWKSLQTTNKQFNLMAVRMYSYLSELIIIFYICIHRYFSESRVKLEYCQVYVCIIATDTY